MAHNITADGTTTVAMPAGSTFTYTAQGSFGSGTLALKYSLNGTLYSIADASLTAATDTPLTIDHPGDTDQLHLVMSGSTTPAVVAQLNRLH